MKVSLNKRKNGAAKAKGKAKAKAACTLPYASVILLGRVEEMLEQVAAVEPLVKELVNCTAAAKKRRQNAVQAFAAAWFALRLLNMLVKTPVPDSACKLAASC